MPWIGFGFTRSQVDGLLDTKPKSIEGVPEGSGWPRSKAPMAEGTKEEKEVCPLVSSSVWLLPAAAPSPACTASGCTVPHSYRRVSRADLPRRLAPYLPSSPQNVCFPLGPPCNILTGGPQPLSSQKAPLKPCSCPRK